MAVPIFRITEYRGKYCVRAEYEGDYYFFRYCYDTITQASEVQRNLAAHFGEPCNAETDLAYNYWCVRKHAGFEPVQRTSQQQSWYLRPQSVAKSELS